MDDMNKYYFDKDEIFDQITLLDKYQTSSEEYKNQGLKIIASYCKPLILTNKGIQYGKELLTKYQNKQELTRKELFDLYILGPEANLITGGKGSYELMSGIWKDLQEKYKPEEEYLRSWIFEILHPQGYFQANENYTKELNHAVKTYTADRPGLRAIFFTVDITIMRDKNDN